MSQNNTISLSDVRSIADFDGFNSHFESLMGVCASYHQAYEMTENLYEKVFGVRKYSSWDCFRVMRCKKKKQKPRSFFDKV